MKKIPDKWLYLPIIILAVNFIYRLVDQSKLLYHFPFDYTNDISSYMAQLFFLDKCGFHAFCPYWYNGFITFQFTPPAWFFFTLPLLKIFGDVKTATYISMLLIFLIALIIFLLFGKLFNFSVTKRIVFFLFFFGNAIAIGNFIRLGDLHQLFGWVFLIILGFIVLYYRNRKLDNYFYLVILVLSIIILSHQTIAVLSPFILLCLFLIKENKERIKIILSGFMAVVITSFWWIPHIQGFDEISGRRHVLTKNLISFDILNLPENIATIIIPIVFWVILYFYLKSSKKPMKEFLFISPIVLLSLLLTFRIVYFVPILKYVYPDSYLYLFLFFSIFIFLKLDLEFIKLNKLVYIALIFISLISVGINIFYTPQFVLNPDIEDTISGIFDYVDDNFLVFGENQHLIYSQAIYSYAPIYYNLSTPEGGSYISDDKNSESIRYVQKNIQDANCKDVISSSNFLGVKYIIAYDEYCENLRKCAFPIKKEIKNVCLYSIN